MPKFEGVERPGAVVLSFELLSTLIEHMGVVYLFIPMLPPLLGPGARRVKAKHHHETEAPGVPEVMQAALAFSVLHWMLRLTFMSEMHPLVTVVKSALANEGWEECLMAVWGQLLGLLVAQVYTFTYYAPRKQAPKR